MMKLLIVIILIFFVHNQAYAETNNVQYFEKNIAIKTFAAIPSVKVAISENDTGIYKLNNLTYKPNNYFETGLAINYKSFGLSIGSGLFTKSAKTKDEGKYGESESTNFQLFYHARKFGFDIYYQKYKGFYLVNADDYGLSSGFTRPDLELSNIGINGYYVFSDNFSFNSSINQTERQLKSGGSFLLMLSFNRFKLESDYSLIPASVQPEYDNYDYIGGVYKSFGISPGYAYSIIYNRFFITPAVFVGTGVMSKKDKYANKERVRARTFNKLNGRLSLGYNGDKYFYSFFAINDTTSTRSWLVGSGLKVSMQVIKVQFNIGMRF